MVATNTNLQGFLDNSSSGPSRTPAMVLHQVLTGFALLHEVLRLHLTLGHFTYLSLPVQGLPAVWHWHLPMCILELHGITLDQ